MMQLSNVFNKTLDAYRSGKIFISNCGGTRSGKTYSTLQLIYFIATGKQKNLMISVVSRSIPHLKRGCLRDWENILDTVGRAGLVGLNMTDRIYTFTNNNKVEFFSADDVGKLHGGQRDMVFINEANYIEKSKVEQIFIRTSGVKFIDYNPSSKFWIEEYRDRDDFIEIHSTYLDNNFLTEEQVKEIESHKSDPFFWSVYGLGEYKARAGRIYNDVEFLEHYDFTNPIYVIDWGFNDPTSILKMETVKDNLYVQQMFYKSYMTPSDIINVVGSFAKTNDIIVCDNARPEIIAELKRNHYRAYPCRKGKDSIVNGITLVSSYHIKYVNGKHTDKTWEEFESYSWMEDDDGNPIDRPEDRNNHSMDAMRYGVTYVFDNKNRSYSYSFV